MLSEWEWFLFVFISLTSMDRAIMLTVDYTGILTIEAPEGFRYFSFSEHNCTHSSYDTKQPVKPTLCY